MSCEENNSDSEADVDKLMNNLRNKSCKQGHKLMEAFLDAPYNKHPRGIFGNEDTWGTVRSNLGLNLEKKPKVWFQPFPCIHEMTACVPNFSNWLVERRITCVDHACLFRITPSQLNNPAQGFDAVQFFLNYWNHCALHEYWSLYKVNQETNQVHGGSHLKEIVLHPNLCCYPKKPAKANQDVVPGCGPPEQPNYHDVSSVECAPEQIDWLLARTC